METRRSVLKSVIGTAAIATLPLALTQAVTGTPAEPPTNQRPGKSHNPAWYGFNLLEYFSTDPDWMKYFFYDNDGKFAEDDYRWIRDWGFNFVRLPMDYRFWTDPDDLMKINERKVEPIDRAIRLGVQYGIHVNICLHRAPGFCIFDNQDPAIGMIGKADLDRGNLSKVHVSVANTDLFTDPQTLDAFAHQWAFFAQRYKGISSERLSFNLVNEPSPRLTPAERAAISQRFRDHDAPSAINNIFLDRKRRYARVARVAIDAIRSIDPQRLIVSDAFGGGTPVTDLIDTGVLQSMHGYYPVALTCYKAEWMPWLDVPTTVTTKINSRGISRGISGPIFSASSTWPIRDFHGRVVIDRHHIERVLKPWHELEQKGVRIHCGEIGCYRYTPHNVMLAWLNDTLHAMRKLHIGWALRNFRGPFGILNTGRDLDFERWYGYKLDRELLTLLQKKMKP